MGHGNTEKKAAGTQYNTALNEAKTETPYERSRREWDEGITTWAKSGDYRQPPAVAKMMFNFADPEERKRRMAVLDDSRGQGVSAMGAGANPTLVALNKQHLDDVAERDAAENYQDTTAKLVGGAYSDLGDLQHSADAKKLNILGVTSGNYNEQIRADAARPRWWQSLLGAAGGAGASFAGSPAGSKMIAGFLKDGGRVQPGKRYVTGEEGPEALVSDDGDAQLVGSDGPTVIRPDAPGTVVPNGQLPDFLRTAQGGTDGAAAEPLTRERRAPLSKVIPSMARATDPPVETNPAPLGASINTHPLEPTLEQRAGVDTSGATEMRERVNDPLKLAVRRVEEDAVEPKATDHNGRLKSGLIGAVRGFFSGGGLVGAGIGAVSHAINPALDERFAQERAHERDAQAAGSAAGARDALSRARLNAANADFAESIKPTVALGGLGLKMDAAAARKLKDEQNAVLSILRLRKGQRLDPSDPRDAALLARAERAHVTVNPDEWNNSASNLASVELVDPDNPTQKRRQFFNKLTGELTDAGQSGYVQPVNAATGMTSNQEHIDADRDAARADLERQRGIQNEFSRVRINQAGQRITLSQAAQDHRFSQDARREMGEAEKLRAQAERWQMEANAADTRVKYFDKDSGEWRESKKWAEKRDEFQARAESLRQQLFGSYGYLWDGRMSREEFLSNFPSLRDVVRRSGSREYGMPTGEVDDLAKKYGVTLTDADTTQGTPGSIRAPAMPRRGAPAQPRGAASPQPSGGYTEQQVRQRAIDQGKDPDAAVAAARAKKLIK